MAGSVSDNVQCFWRHAARFPPEFQARCSHSQSVVGNKLVIIAGGFLNANSADFSHCNDVLVFDLSTQEYMIVQASPHEFTPRRGHSAVVIADNKIVVFAGATTQQGVGTEEESLLNDVCVFDVRTLRWSKPCCHGQPPARRRGHAALMHNNTMIVLGGFTPFLDPMIHILDIETWHWSRIRGAGIVPVLFDIVPTCKVEDRVYFYGGARMMQGTTATYSTMLCLDLEAMEWHELPVRGDLTPARFCPAAGLLLQRYFIVFGGSNTPEIGNTENLNSVILLDLADSWSITCTVLSPKGLIPRARNAAALTCVGNVAIITGGGVFPDAYHDDILLLEFHPSLRIERPQPLAEQTAMLGYFASLYLQHRFSDISLIVNQQHIPAHKVVLAARTEYFRSLLHGNFAESVQEPSNVVLHDVQLEPLLHVLRYLYSGQLDDSMFASQDCLLGVVECAQMLGVAGLVECCEQHLMSLATEISTLEQQLPFLQIAETYGLNRLYWSSIQNVHYQYHYFTVQRQHLHTTGEHLLADIQQLALDEAFEVLSHVTQQRIQQAQTEFLSVDIVNMSELSPIRFGAA